MHSSHRHSAVDHSAEPFPPHTSGFRWPVALSLWLLVGALLGVSWLTLQPSTPQGANAPEDSFSAVRAFRHVEAIAQTPRFVGTEAHRQARDYLVRELEALGFTTEVQETTVASRSPYPPPLRVAKVFNVLGRLEATTADTDSDTVTTIALMAHYDTVHHSPGAADDASGVAAVLEIARALAADSARPGRVMVVFTDAEEVGLFGARAFVQEHPWAQEVDAVLNLESRGSRGPSIFFRVTEGYGGLVRAFASTPRPLVTSTSAAVFRHLPNDTDLTAVEQGGVPGVDAAFIDGWAHYHTELDRPENLSLASLQHQGANGLALVRRLLSEKPSQWQGSLPVAFTVVPGLMVHYPAAFALPLVVVALLLWLAVMWRARKVRRASWGRVLAALPATLFMATGGFALVLVAVQQILLGDPDFQGMRGGVSYETTSYGLATALLAAAVGGLLAVLVGRGLGEENLPLGAALLWLVLAAVVQQMLPGASYLFLWPALFAIAGVALRLRGSHEASVDIAGWRWAASIALALVPALLLWTPVLSLFLTTIGLMLMAGVAAVIGLACGLLAPWWLRVGGQRPQLVPILVLVAAVAVGAVPALDRAQDDQHPSNSSLYYRQAPGEDTAYWASEDPEPGSWTGLYLGGNPRSGPEPGLVGETRQRFHQLWAPAPSLGLTPPTVELLDRSENLEDGTQALRLRVTSQRGASAMDLAIESAADIAAIELAGERFDFGDDPLAAWGRARPLILFTGLGGEPAELTVELTARQPSELLPVDFTLGLPDLAPPDGEAFVPRPPDQVPRQGSYRTDTVSVGGRAFY